MARRRLNGQVSDAPAARPGRLCETCLWAVNWLVDDAMQMEVSVPVIAQSVMQLLASRDQDRNWARAVAMMRHGFGNHPFGPEQRFAANRRTSRVGGFISRAGRP
jgi:hypothetical protein